jgi:hypothetical protein
MTGKRLMVLALALLLSGQGVAWANLRKTNLEKAKPGRKGIVYVIGGVGGYDPLPVSASIFLPMAKVKHDIRGYHWSHGFGTILKDLQDTRHVMRKAGVLAEVILAEKRHDPVRPIYLLANSGGTGLALFAAELLPPETLERIVLLAAAVSPDYDLRHPLRATRQGIVSFYSPLDRIILHWGTWQFGTIDRFYTASAGCKKFNIPADLSPEDRELYQKLVQIPWEPRMMLQGHGGTHSGVHAPGFLMTEVAPWLRD